MDHLGYFCLVLLYFHARLFVNALFNLLYIRETIHYIKCPFFKGVRVVCCVRQLSERWTLKIWPVEKMKLASH